MVETPTIQSSPNLTVMVSLQRNQQSSKVDVPSAVWTRARHTVSGVILPTHSQKKVQRGPAYDLTGVGPSNGQTKGRLLSSKGQG